MLFREAMYRRLVGDAGVSAFVGDRVHRFKLPQVTQLPAICLFVTGATEDNEPINPDERAHTGTVEWRLRVISQGNNANEVEELDEAVRLAMHGWYGYVVDDASPSTMLGIQKIGTDNVRDSYDDVTRTPVIIRDFVVRAAELRPPTLGE